MSVCPSVCLSVSVSVSVFLYMLLYVSVCLSHYLLNSMHSDYGAWSRGVHPPKPMIHLPPISDPPYIITSFRMCENFSHFYLKRLRFNFPLFAQNSYISPYF